ncbi:hypothetical protein AB0I16_10540 [Streptomyces sp. NPDC050703]
MPHPLRRRLIEPLLRLPWPASGRHRLSERARHLATRGVEVVA